MRLVSLTPPGTPVVDDVAWYTWGEGHINFMGLAEGVGVVECGLVWCSLMSTTERERVCGCYLICKVVLLINNIM